MDEVLFRSSQKLEHLQMQLGMVASESKAIINHYAQHGKETLKTFMQNSQVESYKEVIKDYFRLLLNTFKELQNDVKSHTKNACDFAMQFIGKKLAKRDIYFISIGFLCGGIAGIGLGFFIFRRNTFHHYMQAVQCMQYSGVESASVVEDAHAPYYCKENEVLVNVKSASVHVIDAKICGGYGRTIRRLLNKQDLPVILGRDCTGIITDVGSNVKRLEVGDEVWVTVPFWAAGTMCQTILVPENRVSHKPKTIGYESACSLPYAGSIALTTLKELAITPENTSFKRILVTDGCTPVGCVLIQILKLWGAHVTATCHKRATPVATALGAHKVITVENSTDEDVIKKTLIKELELKDHFDYIIKTKDSPLSLTEMYDYCQTNGKVISTTTPDLFSDRYGIITRFIFGIYINLRRLFGGSPEDFNETHMCYMILDKLARLVENGDIQTVVDKVYHPQDIEMALHHIQSPDAIGSTVITFR